MDDYKTVVGKMEIQTFSNILTIDHLDSASGHVMLSSTGYLSLHGWTPEQLESLSECALFLMRRLRGVHASDCATYNLPASPNGPCDCGVGSYTLTLQTKEANVQG